MDALLQSTMASRGFTPSGPVLQVPAGRGGETLYVQKGICPAANNLCQMLFIYLDDRFLGTDWMDPSLSILDVSSVGPGQFSATYANYVQGDPPCCPSQPPVRVTFTWNGSSLRPDTCAPGQQRSGC